MAVRPMRPLVVIPALNEQASVGAVVDAVRTFCPSVTVLVVDDGSADSTAEIARRAGARVASHAMNIGVGGAMRTGFEYALRRGHDAVVQVDADGQHDPALIQRLLEALSAADIVVGSRFAVGGAYPISNMRRLAIRLLSRLVSVHCRTRITDATSGFRAAGPRAIRLFAAHYPSEYLADTVESLVLGGKAGLVITEVPAAMTQRAHGQPSQSILSGAFHLTRSAFVVFQSFIRSVPPDARRLANR